jgi:hypothetical protein
MQGESPEGAKQQKGGGRLQGMVVKVLGTNNDQL